MDKSVFDILFDKKICFAVCVSINTFKNLSIGAISRHYFVLIMKIDAQKMKNFTFRQTDYPGVYSHDLKNGEVKEFKGLSDKFTKIVHDEYGRVYELKRDSFLDRFKIEKELTM
jgi:hypothetical protein